METATVDRGLRMRSPDYTILVPRTASSRRQKLNREGRLRMRRVGLPSEQGEVSSCQTPLWKKTIVGRGDFRNYLEVFRYIACREIDITVPSSKKVRRVLPFRGM